jgi:hypothetical protein
MFFQGYAGGDGAMGYKQPEPVGGMDSVVVTFFFVHGCHDMVEFALIEG